MRFENDLSQRLLDLTETTATVARRLESEEMMKFRVLGPVNVEKDGETLDLGSRKQKTILGVLVANADKPVSSDMCLQAAWGEDVPSGAVRSLHTYVSNLRRIIDPERTEIIEGLDGGYRLNVPAGASVDWIEFEQAEGGDPDTLRSALDLWRGRPFEDIEADWARPVLTSWEQQRLSYALEWADATLERGEHEKVLPVLEELLEEYPLQEAVASRLMLGQYRSGRQAEALNTHKRLRSRLVEELGIDPSPEVQELEERILNQDPTLLPSPGTPTNVPAPADATIGRAVESEALTGFLEATRLLTITGAGGVGKTTAARDLARARLADYPDGVWWFELAPINDPSVVLGEIIGAMRLPPAQSEDALDYLCRKLTGTRTLLVFDNCEHLIETVAQIVAKVLAVDEGVTVLATSREPLLVSGELTWALPPLASPDESVATAAGVLATDAGAFFVAKTRQALPEFSVTDENTSRIASICRRLDGLPFALELAAARLRSMGLSELEGRLDDRFKLLTGGSRSEVPHHQTLRGTVEWSYELLSTDEQTLYAELSAFRGGFDAEAVEAVSDVEDPLPALDSLVTHSLLFAEHRSKGTRYQMLESVREHGQELLVVSDRYEEVRRAHLEWVGNLVREGARKLETTEGAEWSERFREETANIRAALAFAVEHDPLTGAAICGGLSRYWYGYAADVDVTTMAESTSFLDEGRRWSEQMLEADLPPKIRGRLLTGLGGLLLIRSGRLDDAVAKVKEAQEIWTELGDKRNLGWATFYEGVASWSLVPMSSTIALFDRSASLHAEAEDAFGSSMSIILRGLARAASGDVEGARPDLEYAIRLPPISPWMSGHSEDTRSLLAILDGVRDPEALEGAREAIKVFRGIPNYACICHAIQTVGGYLAAVGELEDAARTLGVVQSIRDRLGMVMPPYEDRTFWIDDLGLAAMEDGQRREMETAARAMPPDEGIDWVLDRVDALR